MVLNSGQSGAEARLHSRAALPHANTQIHHTPTQGWHRLSPPPAKLSNRLTVVNYRNHPSCDCAQLLVKLAQLSTHGHILIPAKLNTVPTNNPANL